MEHHTINDRVLISAEELFLRFGFSKTTAEEIARQASVSKRTLYKYFRSKNHILDEVLNRKFSLHKSELNEIINSDELFEQKLHKAMIVTTKILSKISEQFLEDLQRNLPEVWKRISDFRNDMVNTVFSVLLEDGLKQGNVKKDVNKGVAVLLMLSVMERLIDTSADRELSSHLSDSIPNGFDNIFNEITNIIYNGILKEPINI